MVRSIVVGLLTAIAAGCIFVVPAAALAALLGAVYGSAISPDAAWWGAVGFGGFAAVTVSSILALSAMDG